MVKMIRGAEEHRRKKKTQRVEAKCALLLLFFVFFFFFFHFSLLAIKFYKQIVCQNRKGKKREQMEVTLRSV